MSVCLRACKPLGAGKGGCTELPRLRRPAITSFSSTEVSSGVDSRSLPSSEEDKCRGAMGTCFSSRRGVVST